MMRIPNREQGFTLIEAIMVMVITGILAAIVASFIKQPVEAYFDSARRAALTDVADTAVRRMARDIRKAVPNSIRIRNPNNPCIEFIPTKIGGRYRANGIGDPLDFNGPDASFDMFGLNGDFPANQQIVAGDIIVVGNTNSTDAYARVNTSAVTVDPGAGDMVTNETRINITSQTFDWHNASPSNRFQVIPRDETIVSFVCSGGMLYRNANYAYAPSCPAPTPGTTPVLAQNVSFCDFVYNVSDPRNALVQMTINLTDASGETVSLYHEAHVNNTP
jgi:MSHA biogenesis protein MshO